MVLLLLLIVSTFAATLVPPPDDDGDETTSSTSSTGQTGSGSTTRELESEGRLVRRTVSVDAKRPQRVRLTLGDDLELRVTSETFQEVEIPTLGEFDEVDRFAPAVFDLLPDEEGTYPVLLVGETGEDRVIARIVVD